MNLKCKKLLEIICIERLFYLKKKKNTEYASSGDTTFIPKVFKFKTNLLGFKPKMLGEATNENYSNNKANELFSIA